MRRRAVASRGFSPRKSRIALAIRTAFRRRSRGGAAHRWSPLPSADQTLLRTGELRDSIGWEHIGRRETVVGSTDEKAPFHEFGTSRIPRRSFLASTVVEKNDEAFALYMKIFETSFLPR